jgi:hypothetical protein
VELKTTYLITHVSVLTMDGLVSTYRRSHFSIYDKALDLEDNVLRVWHNS